MRDYTTADFLQDPNQSTPLLVRFSQAGGMRGTPDTVRDIRGFAVRFYTGQGNFDLVGNHIPVFFVRDAMRFPETIAALSPSPVNNLPDPERFWRFIGKTPEAMHMLMWLYSDCGTVDSYRHIEGHGVNTYVWKNKQGVRRYVKYHWLPLAGVRCITRQQALELMSQPNIAGQDLYDTLARGEQVEYELYVQLMDPEQADSLPYDPLDDTKVWDTDAFPMVRVGRITLDRNPEDYRAQVENVGFSPANLVPGIELSADRMLQGRAFAYWDSQRRRLGPDFREIPVNRFAGWNPQQTLVTSGNGTTVCGELGRSGIEKTDDFTQARKFYANLSDGQQEHLVDNIASELYQTSEATKQAVLPWLETVHADLVQRVQTRMDWYQSHD